MKEREEAKKAKDPSYKPKEITEEEV